MKYLLLGNSEIADAAAVADGAILDSDCVVQFNLCRHLHLVSPHAQRFVFISNTGTPTGRSVDFLLEHRSDPALRGAVMVRARNPAFYRLKQADLWLRRAPGWRDYTLSNELDRLMPWQVVTMGFGAAWRLESRMRRHGMPRYMMPSTGMIAFDWLQHRMQPGDEITLAGFTWEGWEHHPWALERWLMTEKST